MKRAGIFNAWLAKYGHPAKRATLRSARSPSHSHGARPAATNIQADARQSVWKASVKAERARWVAVLSSPEAVDRGEAACQLLADTNLPASAIRPILSSMPLADTRSKLERRVEAIRSLNRGPAPPDGAAATAAAMREVYERALGRSDDA
jgi:hypothetical protein